MEHPNLIFKNWKCRDSSLGNIMTSLPQPISEEESIELANLLKECETGVNENGRKTKWTDTKSARTKALQKKERGDDELPTGAKSFLDEVFNDVFWGRKNILTNKFLDKGTRQERDVLDVLSRAEEYRYRKSDEELEDEYTIGHFDTEREELKEITDTKANYSKDTFDDAEMKPIYNWQIKGYCIKKGYVKGWLAYGLVNSPRHHITNERVRVLYQMGSPDSDDENWIQTAKLIERNHIFDFAKFHKENPNYEFENKNWEDGRYDIPEVLRIKKFPVTVEEGDSDHIARRVMLARIYLCEKELETYSKCPELKYKATEYYKLRNT